MEDTLSGRRDDGRQWREQRVDVRLTPAPSNSWLDEEERAAYDAAVAERKPAGFVLPEREV